MITYILLVYLLSVFVFFGWALKDATERSIKITLIIFMLSFTWPFVLIVFYLDGE